LVAWNGLPRPDIQAFLQQTPTPTLVPTHQIHGEQFKQSLKASRAQELVTCHGSHPAHYFNYTDIFYNRMSLPNLSANYCTCIRRLEFCCKWDGRRNMSWTTHHGVWNVWLWQLGCGNRQRVPKPLLRLCLSILTDLPL
jgi:hypothetical protein